MPDPQAEQHDLGTDAEHRVMRRPCRLRRSQPADLRRAGRTPSCRCPPSGPRGRCRAACTARSRSRNSPVVQRVVRQLALEDAPPQVLLAPERQRVVLLDAALVIVFDQLGAARVGPCSRRMPVIQPSAPQARAPAPRPWRPSSSARGRSRVRIGLDSRRAPRRARRSAARTAFQVSASRGTARRCRSSRSAPASGHRRCAAARRSAPTPPSGRSTAARRRRGARRRARSVSLRRVGAEVGALARGCAVSDGAFAQTAHSPSPRITWKGDVAVPVDEGVHRLQAEVHRQRELLDEAFQLGRADALHELAPLLALVAGRLVVADPALDRLGHALGRQAQLQALCRT